MDQSKSVIKQVSSGGFIFYQDSVTSEVFVILIQNLKDEWWLPKGKLEKGESQLEAAFREIEEEVGFTRRQLDYVDRCDDVHYSFVLDDVGKVDKDLSINVFRAHKKYTPKPSDWENLRAVKWYLYDEALQAITFDRDKLEKSHSIFTNYNSRNDEA